MSVGICYILTSKQKNRRGGAKPPNPTPSPDPPLVSPVHRMTLHSLGKGKLYLHVCFPFLYTYTFSIHVHKRFNLLSVRIYAVQRSYRRTLMFLMYVICNKKNYSVSPVIYHAILFQDVRRTAKYVWPIMRRHHVLSVMMAMARRV